MRCLSAPKVYYTEFRQMLCYVCEGRLAQEEEWNGAHPQHIHSLCLCLTTPLRPTTDNQEAQYNLTQTYGTEVKCVSIITPSAGNVLNKKPIRFQELDFKRIQKILEAGASLKLGANYVWPPSQWSDHVWPESCCLGKCCGTTPAVPHPESSSAQLSCFKRQVKKKIMVQTTPKDQKYSLTCLTFICVSPAQLKVLFQTLKYIPPVSRAPHSTIQIEKVARTQVLSKNIS